LKSGIKSDGLKAPLAASDSSTATSGGKPRFFHWVAAMGERLTALAAAAAEPKYLIAGVKSVMNTAYTKCFNEANNLFVLNQALTK